MELYGLLNFFEEFYGEKYAGAFLEAMTDYLDGYSREFYLAVRKVMVLRFSRVYNKAPGPAEIERHVEEIIAVMDAMPKPLLPELEAAYATPEEAREWLREIKGMVSRGTGRGNDRSDRRSKMIEITMTEYTVEIHRRKTIRVYGADTFENRDKAREEFIRQIKESIDDDDADIIETVTVTDYEREFEEAV